ncbi:MAG: T9SS type A sorting domain-containing protein [Ignavibacteria bacterium]
MKQETRQWFTLLLAVLAIGISLNLFAQGKQLPPFNIQYSNSNGDVNNTVLTSTPPQIKEKSSELIQLEAELKTARLKGNTAAANQLQEQIDNIVGNATVYQPSMINEMNYGSSESGNQTDYNQSTVHPWSVYSHAFAVAPTGSGVAGNMYCLITQDSQSGSDADTVKLQYSSDGGATWYTRSWFGLSGYSFNRDEMDIEIVYDNTTTWLFGVIGLKETATNLKKVYFLRFNLQSSSGGYLGLLNYPGSGAGMNYYNPRITSDNANYNSNAYVMVLCSMDSTSRANHYAKQKYMFSSTPFAAAPGFTYSNPNSSGGFYWSTALTTNSTAYLYGDIAYYADQGGTGQDRIMTVYNCYSSGFNSIYIAYLNGYSTSGGSMVVTEPAVNKDVKIAFNGGASNRNGMITYVRQFNSSTDWDIFGIRTTNGGSLSGDWNRDTIDYTGNRARTCDLIAVRGAVNQFKICYAEDNTTIPAGFYREYNGSSWSNKILMTNASTDTVWAEPRAGYKLGGGDNGIGIWSLMNGYNGYCARNLLTTTGISGNNEIPTGFSLSQNYPNPFNPTTKIKFALPVSGKVSLKIFDITGRLVTELVDQNLEAGTHEINFNASDLSSGAYFYKLETKGFSDIKKMILVK